MSRPSRTGGKISEAKARNASPAKGRKTTKTKPRIVPAATRVKRRSISGPSKDLKEAREQQAATAEILKVIARSPNDVQPVFDAIASSSKQLIGGIAAVVYRFFDGIGHLAAFTPVSTAADAALKATFPQPIANVYFFQSAQAGEVVQVSDTEAHGNKRQKQIARARGFRSVLFAPLMNKGASLGVIAVNRKDPGPFSAHHVQLLQTFADQAVIAIENVRLFDEVQAKTRDLEESLQFQTASSDVLKVISRSPDALQPVLDAIAETSRELCGSDAATIFLLRDEKFHFTAVSGVVAKHVEYLRANPAPINEPGSALKQLALKKHTLHYPNVMDDPELDSVRSRLGGPRALLLVPLMRDGEVLGTIVLRQSHLRPFTPRQIQAIETFADQAVIAIGNVRLFEEVQAKTRDLTESLQQQTATSEVLEAISSSPGDLQPVFKSMLNNALRICEAKFGQLLLFNGRGFLAAELHNTPAAYAELFKRGPLVPGPNTGLGRLIASKKVIHIPDVMSGNLYAEREPLRIATVEILQARTLLAVPMLKDPELVGAIIIYRQEVRPFSHRQIELVTNFAAQAVIAIENTRLLRELRQRTDDLSESLQQQTATADVLKVISRSAFDLDTVMDTLASSARDLCGSKTAALFLRDGDMLVGRSISVHELVDEEFMRANPVPVNDESHLGRAVLTGKIANIGDFENDPHTKLRKFQQIMGFKSFLAVPLMREGRGVGVFALTRDELGRFSERQVELVQGFADQAVIAIENTRLFNETTRALEQQTATADILKVIASSPDDVQPVFQAIAERSNRIVEGLSTAVVRLVDDTLYLMAYTPVSPDADAALQAFYPQSLSSAQLGDAIRRAEVVQIADSEVDFPKQPAARDLARKRGWRSALFVPLLRDRKHIGMISVTRVQPGRFADHHVQLLQTFADQAVIAISNVELFQQVQERTRELSQSLDDLRAAQDRLVQTEKLASLGQLTAGIAHEIKNPLNFVNNFSALSSELTDELNDVLKPVALDSKVRGEVDELTGLLKDNLEKVVQHGKRADSIVKNMLLHSREGSGEHRPADINSLLDESLNLAYHGARAEKGEFNVTLQRDFDADAGTIELFPQEITRAFLNLIANGVYAATRRKTEDKEPWFEPTLRATTKNLGTTVEIRIRDNGSGIPAEVREKMFNPFFTTKPAGEGTGLGLSMTHDIIVKQHGGRIDVDTEPGSFTEFIITLPRKTGAQRATGGTN